jgi:hypothetical protein
MLLLVLTVGVSKTCHFGDTPYICSYWLSSVLSTCYDSLSGSSQFPKILNCTGFYTDKDFCLYSEGIGIGSRPELLADLAYVFFIFTAPRTYQESKLLCDRTQASPQSLTTKHSGRILCSHTGCYEKFYLLGYDVQSVKNRSTFLSNMSPLKRR